MEGSAIRAGKIIIIIIIDHLLSSCEVLTKTEYIVRYNTVAKYIHWCICRASGFDCSSVWWNHQPPSVLDSEQCGIRISLQT